MLNRASVRSVTPRVSREFLPFFDGNTVLLRLSRRALRLGQTCHRDELRACAASMRYGRMAANAPP